MRQPLLGLTRLMAMGLFPGGPNAKKPRLMIDGRRGSGGHVWLGFLKSYQVKKGRGFFFLKKKKDETYSPGLAPRVLREQEERGQEEARGLARGQVLPAYVVHEKKKKAAQPTTVACKMEYVSELSRGFIKRVPPCWLGTCLICFISTTRRVSFFSHVFFFFFWCAGTRTLSSTRRWS